MEFGNFKNIRLKRTSVYLGLLVGICLLSCKSLQKTTVTVIPPPTEAEIIKAIENLEVPKPNRKSPVNVAVTVVPKNAQKGQIVSLLTKVSMLRGWHIYARVPKSKPFITSKISFEVPKNIELEGELQKPKPRLYPSDSSILVYKNEVYFKQNIKVTDTALETVKLGVALYYQACDRNRCLTPKTKKLQTTLNIKK